MKLFGMILLVGSLAIGLSPARPADQNAAKERSKRPSNERSPVDVAEDTATHREIEPLSVEFQRLTSLQLDNDGNLLACDGDTKQIKVIGPDGTDRFTSGGAHAASCSNMAIAATPDGNRIYVMDYNHNRIRVLQKKD